LGCQLLRFGPGTLEGGWQLSNCAPKKIRVTYRRAVATRRVQFLAANSGAPCVREEFKDFEHRFDLTYENPAVDDLGTRLTDPPDFPSGYYVRSGNPPNICEPIFEFNWPVNIESSPSLTYLVSETNFKNTLGVPEPASFGRGGLVNSTFCMGLYRPNADYPGSHTCPGFRNSPCGFVEGARVSSPYRKVLLPAPNADYEIIEEGTGTKITSNIMKISPCSLISGDWSYSANNTLDCCCDNPNGTIEFLSGNDNFGLLAGGLGSCGSPIPDPPCVRISTFSDDAYDGGFTICGEIPEVPSLGDHHVVGQTVLEQS